MAADGFFQGLGEVVGAIVRFIVDALSGLFNVLGGALGSFFEGVAKTLGITPSIFSLMFVALGLWLLFIGIRGVVRKAYVSGVIWLLLGLWLLGALIS